MNAGMSCKIALILVRFAAFVALEWSFTTMRPYMALQGTRGGKRGVTFITLVRFFCCVIQRNMSFQIPKVGAGIFAHCASVGLFSRMGPLMCLQVM